MMAYGEYVSGICFRYVKPLTVLPGICDLGDKLLKSVGIYLDVINTRLPNNDHIMKDRLREICKMPRMSTFAIGAMINFGVSQMPDNLTFVNVGVWHGFSLLSGMIGNAEKQCVGIDSLAWFGKPREVFLRGSTSTKIPIIISMKWTIRSILAKCIRTLLDSMCMMVPTDMMPSLGVCAQLGYFSPRTVLL